MEEIYHSVAQQLDDERQRKVSAVQMLNIAENSNKDLKEKLKTEEQLRKSAEAALKGAETQAESQRKLVEERDEAEQHGYDVGVAETEDALRAEVPVVCRAYCAQTWEEALNQARVEASSGLRKP